MKIVSLLLSLCLASLALAEDPAELAELRQTWEKERTEAQEKIDTIYLEELEQLKKNFTKAGNIADALAVDNVIKEGDRADNEPQALTKVRLARDKSLKKVSKPLDKRYWQDLLLLKDDFQKQGNLDGVVAADAEIEKVLATYKKPPASILRYSYEPKESYGGRGAFDYTDKALELLTDGKTFETYKHGCVGWRSYPPKILIYTTGKIRGFKIHALGRDVGGGVGQVGTILISDSKKQKIATVDPANINTGWIEVKFKQPVKDEHFEITLTKTGEWLMLSEIEVIK